MEIFELIQSLEKSDKRLIKSTDELDKAIDHIVQLIKDSAYLYQNGSFPSSAFLSITACEEAAKAHIGIYTDGKLTERESRNVFREHKTKHEMATTPTLSMGQRLKDELGKGEIQRIMNMARNAGFVKTRENALYFQRENGKLVTPTQQVDKNLARSLVLFSIEVFDDALAGYTNHSYKMGDLVDKLFEQIRNT